MDKDPYVYLDDMVQSCANVAGYVQGVSKEEFERNELVQDAVMRRLEIIGEAAKNVPQVFRDLHPDIAWRSAAGMRDVLIHAYNEVQLEQVWNTATVVLPAFAAQIRSLCESRHV